VAWTLQNFLITGSIRWLFVHMESILGFYFVTSRATINSSSSTLHHRITHLFSSTNEANSDTDAHEFMFLQQWISLQRSVTPYTQRCGFLSVSLAPVSPGLHFITYGAAMTWFTHSLDEKSPLCWHQQTQTLPNISTYSFVLTCINSPYVNAELCKLQIANTMFRLKPHYVHSHKHKLFHMTCKCIHRNFLLSKCVQSNIQFSHMGWQCAFTVESQPVIFTNTRNFSSVFC
jgi:hypothetical protein